jgi:DNA/RNA-binding domain of Phe-tRNA-synthetase-like protein
LKQNHSTEDQQTPYHLNAIYYNFWTGKKSPEQTMVEIAHHIPRADVLLGVLRAENLRVDRLPDAFEAALAALLAVRQQPLSADSEARRQAVRDLLRNGAYKPTGRAKPASEYLLRAAQENAFPRINAVVDVANFISLREMLPVSLWDLDRAQALQFRFRLGRKGETYVFNRVGQTIDLHDLIVGCRVDPQTMNDEPIVNPVKDSLATKTHDGTRRIAACVYAPASVVTAAQLHEICRDFAGWLLHCGSSVQTAWAVLMPGQQVVL